MCCHRNRERWPTVRVKNKAGWQSDMRNRGRTPAPILSAQGLRCYSALDSVRYPITL